MVEDNYLFQHFPEDVSIMKNMYHIWLNLKNNRIGQKEAENKN